jgi:hypothetical protein
MTDEFSGFKVVLDESMPTDEIRMVSNPSSEIPNWFRKVMLDNGFCSFSPPIMDAEPMTKADIIMRRRDGNLLHKYAVWDRGVHPCFLKPDNDIA